MTLEEALQELENLKTKNSEMQTKLDNFKTKEDEFKSQLEEKENKIKELKISNYDYFCRLSMQNSKDDKADEESKESTEIIKSLDELLEAEFGNDNK